MAIKLSGIGKNYKPDYSLSTAGQKKGTGGIRNTYGNDYRSSMNTIKSIGGDIRGLSGTMSGVGGQLMSQYQNIFNPAMRQAQQYADVNPEQLVDEASLGVGSAYDKAAGIRSRGLSRYGISPTSGKYQGQMQDLNLMRAATEAGARNKARIQARDLSFGRNLQIARGVSPMASQAIGAYGQAAGAGRTAAGIHNLYATQAGRSAGSQARYEEMQKHLQGQNGINTNNSTTGMANADSELKDWYGGSMGQQRGTPGVVSASDYDSPNKQYGMPGYGSSIKRPKDPDAWRNKLNPNERGGDFYINESF